MTHDPRITEHRNRRSAEIDLASPEEIVDLLNSEDRTVADAVISQRSGIARAVVVAEETFRGGGRLFYVGAGTSGRLGVLDATEIPPTFGASPELVQGIIAGGPAALTRSQEGAEDRPEAAAADLDAVRVGANDFVIGIAASGTTSYVLAALAHAKRLGARTAIVACSPPPPETLADADIAIVAVTGPEVVTGSTRLKAGTATKLILNTITTGAMIRLGKTYGNLMVDLQATNDKLRDRSERIVREVCGVTREDARALLHGAGGSVKLAIVMNKMRMTADEARRALAGAGGIIRRIVKAPASAHPMSVVVGLMSGTSLDGISAAVVRFHEIDGRITPDLLASVSIPYTSSQRARLSAALVGVSPREYARLDFDLGDWLATAAATVIAEAGIPRAEIAGIASHGHTVWHEPPHATWQFGQAAVIAERTGIPVISDFRARDVAAGGQGAPLVPMADAVLFGARDHWRALQNLGGIGNVTIVPPAANGLELASVRAFDTGPGVVVIDALVSTLCAGKTFDEGGALARKGKPIKAVVDHLLAHPFFAAPPPRSTGRELYTRGYVEAFRASCKAKKPRCTTEDIVATAVSLTARSIALAFERFIPEPVAEVVLSGGGARNPALFDAIERELSTVTASGSFQARRIVTFDDVFFDGEAKEAVAFAFLGWLHLNGRPGNVPSATGARAPRILGTLTPR